VRGKTYIRAPTLPRFVVQDAEAEHIIKQQSNMPNSFILIQKTYSALLQY